MTTRETSAEIDEAASIWAARIDRAPLRADETAALNDWLAGDIRRMGAMARMQATMVRTQAACALGAGFDPEDFRDPPAPGFAMNRRRILQIGAGALATAGAAAAGLVLWVPGQARYTAPVGEMKRITLSDGSLVSLNTASVIKVSFTDHMRQVTLVAGEALFEVARDVAGQSGLRPFVVVVGKTTLEAMDTAFSVRRQMGAAVRVLVERGRLQMRRGDQAAMMLSAGMLAQVDEDPAVPLRVDSVNQVDMDSGLSWLQGNLSFRSVRLDAAAEEFARYDPDTLIVVDPSLREHRITGAFAARDPEGFAQAVAISYGLRVEREGRTIRLVPPL